jgi:hypothetical protein
MLHLQDFYICLPTLDHFVDFLNFPLTKIFLAHYSVCWSDLAYPLNLASLKPYIQSTVATSMRLVAAGETVRQLRPP